MEQSIPALAPAHLSSRSLPIPTSCSAIALCKAIAAKSSELGTSTCDVQNFSWLIQNNTPNTAAERKRNPLFLTFKPPKRATHTRKSQQREYPTQRKQYK
eukprot:scaffold869_cov160-Ochromonas_danica.AAC.25